MGIIDDWEARGEYHNLCGQRIFVADLPARGASGPPLLVLHGFPTNGADWRLAFETIASHPRVIVPDLLGYGLSAKPDQHYSLYEQADIVEALAQKFGLDTVTLVTHDMGDSVGGEVLARSIDGTLGFGIDRRVLTNGSIYIDMAHLTDGQKFLCSLPDERLDDGVAASQELLEAALRATFAPASDVDAGEVEAMAAFIVRDRGNTLLPRVIRYIEERRVHEHRWTGAIERHPASLAVIWGDLDPIAIWPMAERVTEANVDARLYRLDGVGHYPMVESPKRFADALSAAITR
jgi:pimeloyl-ACP methyl ester carboxylesterase